MASSSPRKVAVVGAGPVGCLASIAFAKMGWDVETFELRDYTSIFSDKTEQSRSINLTLSARGISAMEDILDTKTVEGILATTVPMRSRMIHHENGKLKVQAYSRHGQCIYSTDRVALNAFLVTQMRQYTNIRMRMRHKVQSVNFEARTLVAHDLDEDKDVTAHFDLCIGTDGAYSAVRRHLMRSVRMDYSQHYIPHEYLELKIPSATDEHGKPVYPLPPNHVHIWPRHSLMFLALPNTDGSFTGTLFAPSSVFATLTSLAPEEQLRWFAQKFPDAVPLLGEDALLKQLAGKSSSPLISVNAKPYHYRDCAVILGDAAHAMVPFYAQGLNCGLEDVKLLAALVRQHTSLDTALHAYSQMRYDDVTAIGQMAMENYVELRHSVAHPLFHVRKTLDDLLAMLTASRAWIPRYTMVAFRPDIGYAAVKRRSERQARWLGYLLWALLSALVAVLWYGGVAIAAAV